eukprot:616985-Prymnesium_polylepis.1
MGAHDGLTGQRVQDLALTPRLELTLSKLARQQVRGRARESDSSAEEDGAAHVLSACRQLLLLEPHECGEGDLAKVPIDKLWARAEELEQGLGLQRVGTIEHLQGQK